MFCSKCGTPNHDNNHQCVNCGSLLHAAPAQQPTAGKSRLAYILLGLFLGFFGIHNFYAGYNGRGIVQLLITLLIGWTLIPLIVLTLWFLIEIVATDTDAQGVALT